MGAGDVIFIRQVHTGSHGYRLFTDIQMGETRDSTPCILIHYFFFKVSDL